MPREGRGRRRGGGGGGGGLHLPDLRDAEGETAARLGRLGSGLRTRAASPVVMDHPSSSSGAVAPESVVRRAETGHTRDLALRPLAGTGPSTPAGRRQQGPKASRTGAWQEAPVTG